MSLRPGRHGLTSGQGFIMGESNSEKGTVCRIVARKKVLGEIDSQQAPGCVVHKVEQKFEVDFVGLRVRS